MGECRGSIDAVKRAEGELTEDEDDVPGLTNPTSIDTQSGQLHVTMHTDTGLSQVTYFKYCATCLKLIYKLFSSRCDRALGTDPGSVSEWEEQA